MGLWSFSAVTIVLTAFAFLVQTEPPAAKPVEMSTLTAEAGKWDEESRELVKIR